MNKNKLVEQEIKQFHQQWIAEYIAKVVEIEHRIYGNEKGHSYKSIYKSCLDTITYNKKEQEDIYKHVDDILTNDYQLIIVNGAFDEDIIYLVDLNESEED